MTKKIIQNSTAIGAFGYAEFSIDSINVKKTKYKRFFKSKYEALKKGSYVYNVVAILDVAILNISSFSFLVNKIHKHPFEVKLDDMKDLKIGNYSDGYGGKGVRIKFTEKTYGFKVNIGLINKEIKQDVLVAKVQELFSSSQK